MEAANWLPFLLGLAVLLPLVSFFAILIFGPRVGKAGESAAYLATGAIGFAAFLSWSESAQEQPRQRNGAAAQRGRP